MSGSAGQTKKPVGSAPTTNYVNQLGQPQSQPNVFDQSAGAFGSAGGTLGTAGNTINQAMTPFGWAGQSFGNAGQAYQSSYNPLAFTAQPGSIRSSMNQFLNPYREQVIDASLGRLRDRRDVDLNMIKGNAAQSGAFGGSRHGLLEAETIDNYGQQEDELAARMLQQGFDTSSNLAVQQLGLMQSGAAGLQNIGAGLTGIGQARTGLGNALVGASGAQTNIGNSMAGLGTNLFNIGQQANAGQAQAGGQQQQLLQAILSGAGDQYNTYANYPQQQLSTLLAALSGNPLSGNQSQSYKPGIFDYLSLGAGTYAAGK